METPLSQSEEILPTPGNYSDPSITKRLFDLATTIDQYYTPILCLFGTIGNCLSIIVFLSKSPKARGSLSSSVYLTALAISDTGYLINLFIQWMDKDNIGVNLLTNWLMCPTVTYLGQVTGFLSVWFIVAFTVERFFAVCYPLFRPSRCTASRARKIVIGLTLFAVLGFSYVLVIARSFIPELEEKTSEKQHQGVQDPLPKSQFNESLFGFSLSDDSQIHWMGLRNNSSNGSQQTFHSSGESGNLPSETNTDTKEYQYEPMCSVRTEYHHLSEISNYFDTALTFLIPFVLIAALNLKIIFCVKRIKGQRENMLASSKLSYRLDPRLKKASKKSKRRFNDYLSPCHKKCIRHCSNRDSVDRNVSTRSSRCSRKSIPLESPIGISANLRNHSDSTCSKCQNENENVHHDHCSQVCLTTTTTPTPTHENTNRKHVQYSSSVESDSQSSLGQVTPPFKKTALTHQPNATEIRVTKTLLLVSTVFLLLHFPSHSIRIAMHIWGSDRQIWRRLIVAQHFTNLLFNTNFGVNFLLYCCSGKAFRHSLKSLLCWNFYVHILRRKPPSPTNTVATTQLTLNNTDNTSITGKYATRVSRSSPHHRKSMEEDQV